MGFLAGEATQGELQGEFYSLVYRGSYPRFQYFAGLVFAGYVSSSRTVEIVYCVY